MKAYKGHRDERYGNQLVFVLRQPEDQKPYPLRQVWKDEAVGFAWGYAGSGPDSLAHSILADLFGTEDVPPAVYKKFNADFLENCGTELKITQEQIVEWIANRRWSLTDLNFFSVAWEKGGTD